MPDPIIPAAVPTAAIPATAPAAPAPTPTPFPAAAPAPVPTTGVGVAAPVLPTQPGAPAAVPSHPAVDPALAAAQAQIAQLSATLRSNQRYVQLGMQAAAQQPAAPAAQPATPANPFGLPSYDPNWKNHLEQDQDGRWQERPGAPLGTLTNFLAYHTNMPNAVGKLLSDPVGTLIPLLEKAIEERAMKVAQAQYAEVESRQAANQIMAEVEPWAIAKNADGSPIMGYDATGQQVEQFTPLGQHYAQAAYFARQGGMTDMRAIHKYAMTQVELVKARMPAAPPAAPVAPAAPLGTVAAQFTTPGFPQAPNRTPAPGSLTVPATLPAPPAGVQPDTRALIRQAAVAAGYMQPAAA